MDTTLYVSLSHQVATRRKLDLIANNIANVNTTAFRREGVRFDEYLVGMKDAEDPLGGDVSYVHDYGVLRDFVDGAPIPTGNDLDLAIQGPGFFMVEATDGETRYTRNGHFKLNDLGEMSTSNGSRVLSPEGNPITIPVTETEIVIASDGSISGSTGPLGNLALVEFQNRQELKKIGESQYSSDEEPTPSETSDVKQGFVESSNVNAVAEITDMIKVMRSYQTTAKLMEDYQKMRGSAISRLAKVGN